VECGDFLQVCPKRGDGFFAARIFRNADACGESGVDGGLTSRGGEQRREDGGEAARCGFRGQRQFGFCWVLKSELDLSES
jgi:hypothetical protein